MPKRKRTKRAKTRKSHSVEKELEQGTVNAGASSSNECSTIFNEYGKRVELSCEVEYPKHQELTMPPLFASEVISPMDMDMKQELLNDIIGNSDGQLLDSAAFNITERNAVATLENCVPNKIKTESAPEIIVIDDSDEFTTTDSDQELDDTYLRKLKKSEEAKNLAEEKTLATVSKVAITSMPMKTMHNSTNRELDFKTIDNYAELESQGSYIGNLPIDITINREHLGGELNTSLVPSSEKSILKSTAKIGDRIDSIQYSTISNGSLSNSSTPSFSSKTKQTNDFSEPANSNLHEPSLLSDPGVNNIKSIQRCPIFSNFHIVEPMNEIGKPVLQADQERSEISPAAVIASSSEQIYVSNAEYPNSNINTTLESMPMSVCQVQVEAMSDSNASIILSTSLENSAIPALNLNTTFNENNISKASIKMKEEPTDTKVSHFMATGIMSNNAACSNEISENEENTTPAYFNIFASSWGLADEPEAEKFDLALPFFSELGLFLRTLGHKKEKTETAKTFCERAMKEHVFNKEISNSDHRLLKNLFPTEVPDPSEINEVNEIEKHNAHIRHPPTSNPLSVTEVKCEIANTENYNSSEITPMDLHNANIGLYPEAETIVHSSQNSNGYLNPQVSKAGINIERTLEVPKLEFQKIVQTFPTQTLQDIIANIFNNSNENVKNPLDEVEPFSMSNQPVIENNSSHSQLVPSPIVFDDEREKNYLPDGTRMEMHSAEHSLHSNSDDSSVNNSRFDNSSDSDATTKNISFEEALSPELSLNRKKKMSNQHPEFIPRKKSRYEIILERKEREKSLQLGNCSMKEKNMTSCNKTSQLSTNGKYKGLEIFHPIPAISTPSQQRKATNSKCDDTVNEKAKVKPVAKKTEMDTCKEKKDGKLSPSQSVRDTEKSDPFGFKDLNAGMRFKNRNSSLFEDVTKVAQQPTPYRARPVRQKNPPSNSSRLNMEEMHAQVDTDSITISELPKKKLSLKEYQLRAKILSSLNNDLLNTDTRSFSPNTQSFFESHSSLDPQSARRQSGDSPNLNCVQGYQPNAMEESILPSNNFMTALPTSNYLPNSGHNPRNISVPMENQVLSTMASVSNSTNVPHVHYNRNSPASAFSFVSPLQTPSSDDMELCDFETSTIIHSTSQHRFASSYRTQNFGCTASSASYVLDPRLQPTSHYGISPSMSAAVPSESVNLPCLINEDDPREVDLIPLRLLDSVGQTVMTSYDALMIVLSWVPNWLQEVDRPDQKNPPPLLRNTAVLKETRHRYADMPNHFTTIFPLMLFDLFFRMHDMMRSKISGNATRYVFDIVKSTQIKDVMEIEAKMLLFEKPLFSIGGQLAVMTYGLTCGKKRDVFAFIENQHIYSDPTTNEEVLRTKIIHGVRNLNVSEKIYVLPFYSFSKFLNQVDALGYIKKSPLRDIILNPYQPACTKILLERVGGPAESVHIVDHAVEKIKNGISLNEPEEPRILIIDSPPGTDLMSTLIAIIDDVKKLEISTQKHRILICTRTLKQLENIGMRLFSVGRGESERPVIAITILLKAKGIPNEMLKKLTLEHQIFQFMKSVKKTNTALQEQLSEDLDLQEVKRDIFRNSDVVLSRIPQNYDNDLQTFFGIGKDFQFSFCIIDEAYIFTEPEASLPLLYDINKLILAGETQEKRKGVVSKLSDRYGYYQPLPLRLSLALEE